MRSTQYILCHIFIFYSILVIVNHIESMDFVAQNGQQNQQEYLNRIYQYNQQRRQLAEADFIPAWNNIQIHFNKIDHIINSGHGKKENHNASALIATLNTQEFDRKVYALMPWSVQQSALYGSCMAALGALFPLCTYATIALAVTYNHLKAWYKTMIFGSGMGKPDSYRDPTTNAWLSLFQNALSKYKETTHQDFKLTDIISIQYEGLFCTGNIAVQGALTYNHQPYFLLKHWPAKTCLRSIARSLTDSYWSGGIFNYDAGDFKAHLHKLLPPQMPWYKRHIFWFSLCMPALGASLRLALATALSL